MKMNSNLPTIFAISLARSVGLMHEWDPNDEDMKMADHTAEETRMVAFQQMAIGCDFEDALIAYHGVDLTKEQKVTLNIVYKSTVPWLVGHVVGELLDSMGGGVDKGKTAELILSELLKDGKVNPEIAKELVVKLQVLKPGGEVEKKK